MTSSAATADAASDLDARLAAHAATLHTETSVARFFASHPWLLRDPDVGHTARTTLSRAKQRSQAAHTRLESTRRRLAARKATARRAALRAAPPRRAICVVFGPRCDEALQVAHCESRLRTTARNGQYRGLFQMGTSERRLFGHGATAYEQARAAHRYFVRSGRDWSPWSCKPRR
jgi:hypothetical protein